MKSNSVHTHVLVVLLQEDELLPHGFDLTLDVHPAHVGVVDDFLQASDVGLHRLTDRHLVVKPSAQTRSDFLFFILSDVVET